LKSLDLVLRGGLGNQLFQYFAGLELSKAKDRVLRIDNSWYQREVHLNGMLDARDYELDLYIFELNYTKLTKRGFLNNPKIERISRALPRRTSLLLGHIQELGLEEDSPRKRLTTFGHWISQEFIPNRETARKLLVDGLRTPSSRFLELKDEASNKNVIAVHVRMGDYRNFQSVYGTTGPDYYTAVLKKMRKSDAEIWLFSDEPKAAERLISYITRVDKVISIQDSLNSAENIALMSCAQTIVASNSTFSWWASFLSLNSTIFFPKWYMVGKETKHTGLYVEDWNYV